MSGVSWREPLQWLEGLLRAALWRLESRLALVTIAGLALLITVAAIWWDSSDEVRNFGLIAAAVIALPLAIWRSRVSERQAEASRRQAETAHRALLDDRYHRAVEMLDSADSPVREAAARTLHQLASAYPDEYEVQVSLLLKIEKIERVGEGADDDQQSPLSS